MHQSGNPAWVKHIIAALLLACALTVISQRGVPSPLRPDDQPDENVQSQSLAKEFETSYKRAWQLIRDNTMFPERLGNWQRWEHQFDGQLKSASQLQNAVNQMLSALGDQYTYFRNESDTRNWRMHDEDTSVVTACRLNKNIAFVSIHSFSSLHTASELESALSQYRDVHGYILDLRGNRGGYVEQALSCFELLTNEGAFVSMIGREEGKPYCEVLTLEPGYLRRTVNGITAIEKRKKNLTRSKTLVVLVDEDTRSAAEMLAGALKDVGRAKLVGSKTFGKGVVQSSWSLDPGCSIKVAMAHYYLPSGKDINGVGIIPDYPLHISSPSRLPHAPAATKQTSVEISRLQEIIPALPIEANF